MVLANYLGARVASETFPNNRVLCSWPLALFGQLSSNSSNFINKSVLPERLFSSFLLLHCTLFQFNFKSWSLIRDWSSGGVVLGYFSITDYRPDLYPREYLLKYFRAELLGFSSCFWWSRATRVLSSEMRYSSTPEEMSSNSSASSPDSSVKAVD